VFVVTKGKLYTPYTHGGAMRKFKMLSRRRRATRVGIMVEGQETWRSKRRPRRKPDGP
jgi:hypothetical protein